MVFILGSGLYAFHVGFRAEGCMVFMVRGLGLYGCQTRA